MEITNTKVYDLEYAVIRSGLAMETEPKNIKFDDKGIPIPTEHDWNRAKGLSKCPKGTGHDSFLKLITVQFDLKCTNKLWVQWGRYHFVDIGTSQSTMHRLKWMDLDNAYYKYVDDRVIEIMKELQQKYNKTEDLEDYYKLLYTNPVGMELTARVTTNYLQLKTMYDQRGKHPLLEWKYFKRWVEQLPHSYLITNHK